MSQKLNSGDREKRLVRTPDGQEFGGAPARGAGNFASAAFAGFFKVVRAIFVAVWTFVRTVWRLAEALDSALWRGVKLAAVTTTQFTASTARASAAAFAEVFRWLPSRSGRAYAAGSSVVLVLCALWAADEIRNARSDASALDSIFRPPLDLTACAARAARRGATAGPCAGSSSSRRG
jgi:hypothetical protein